MSSRISRQDFYVIQGEQFLEESFDGSLPAFIAAFTARKKLSDAEVSEIMDLIHKGRG